MKHLSLSLLFILPFLGWSQSFYDVLDYHGESYLISPSPSRVFFETDEESYSFKGLYYIEGDQLYLDHVLSVNKKLVKQGLEDSIMQMDLQPVVISDTFKLVLISNFSKTLKMVEKTGVHIGDDWTFMDNLVVKDGKINLTNPFTQELMEDWGFLSIDGYWDELTNIKITDDKGREHYGYDYFNFEEYETSLKLPVGMYTVELFYGDQARSYTNIEINSSEITTLRPSDPYYDVDTYGCYYCNGYDPSTDYLIFAMRYGNNTINQSSNNEINTFGVGFKYGGQTFIGASSTFSAIAFYGFDYNFHNQHPNGITINNETVKQLYYSHLGMEMGGAFRMYFSKYKKAYQNRPFIELGAYYNLPVIFRQMSRFDNYKLSERWIHKFNDVSAYCSIGVNNRIAITGEYRIFDVVKSSNAQLPRIQVGISFNFTDF